ncbi:MAG: hypothetical protein QOG87_2594 [Actinomycetota bacterium]
MRSRFGVLAASAALLVVGGVPARAATPARSFTVAAAAFPVEPAPGLNKTSLGIRPAASRAALANPPGTAYGRAAAYDVGTIELYTGPPPPESVAECDTGSANIPDKASAAPAGMQLEVTCDERPGVKASAAGSSYSSAGLTASSVHSTASADGSGDVVVSEASADVHGVSMGPLVIDSVTMRASARAGGAPGTAAATGRVVASGATVNGTPVVIGADGIEVDRQRVPLDLVASATAAMREALGQGGYADVRIVQPATEARADGSAASVRGGGVMLFFNRNDSAQNYFVRITFAGVDLAVDVGAPLVAATGDGAAAVPPTAGAVSDNGVLGASRGTSVAPSVTGTGAPAAAVPGRPVLTSGQRTYDLPAPWQGWPALVAIGAGALVGGWLARRRLFGWWAANADRYLRG